MSYRKVTAMALAEAAIQVKYRGNKAFAIVEVDGDGGAGSSPLISLGVSDTSLAQAVTNMVTVFTGAASGASSEMRDVVANINGGSGGTIDGDDDIKIGDFMCRLKNSIESDSIYHAAIAMFEDEAGTNNVREGWTDSLTWDNDVDSVAAVRLKIPQPDVSEASVGIETIKGVTCQSTNATIVAGIKRELLDQEGTVLWTASEATLEFGDTEIDKDFGFLIAFDNGPLMVKDSLLTASNSSELTKTAGVVTWGFIENNL